MDDDPAALRARAAADIAQLDAMLDEREWDRIRRQMAGGHEDPAQRPAPASAWTPPPPRQMEPSSPRPRPEPRPPVPDKITRIQHDAAGRITATETYSGAGAAAARSWQGYIEDRIGAQILDFAKEFGAGIGEVLAEIRTAERERADAAIAALTRRIEELEQSRERPYAAAAD